MKVAPQNPDSLLSNLDEFLFGKLSELFAEAIPCGLNQTSAWIESETKSTLMFVSILVSALSVGYSVAMASYNWDTSPEKRKVRKWFYGYYPDGGRNIVFNLQTIQSSSQFFQVCVTLSFFYAVNSSYPFLFYGSSIVFFLLYKIIRGDFLYFFRIEGTMSWVVSLLMRVAVKTSKTIADLLH